MTERTNISGDHRSGAEATVLIIVDMVNDFAFDEGHILFESALSAARNIDRLRRRLDCPTIFVNDNFHNWRGGFG